MREKSKLENKKTAKHDADVAKGRKKFSSKKKLIIEGIAIILLATIIYTSISFIYPKIKYDEYTKIIEKYGFNVFYDNSKASSYQKANFGEVIKISCGVILNKTDNQYAVNIVKEISQKEMTVTEAWEYLVKYFGVNVGDRASNEGVTKVQAAIALVKEIENILETKIDITQTIPEKYIKLFEQQDIDYVNKALSLGIIEDSTSDLKSGTLLKGELNKMLVQVMQKFNTLYYKTQARSGNGEKVIIDEELLPNNANIYPYILDSIDKDIYEITTSDMNFEISETPLEVYNTFKEGFSATEENVNEYFDDILNVDYRTINLEKFIQNLNVNMVYDINQAMGDGHYYRDMIEKYVDYVVENKIILKGKSTTLLPIIYSNGLLHYIRVKINLQIINTDTAENLLLWDENVKYTGRNIEFYVDVPVSRTYGSKDFKIYNGESLITHTVKSDGNMEVSE